MIFGIGFQFRKTTKHRYGGKSDKKEVKTYKRIRTLGKFAPKQLFSFETLICFSISPYIFHYLAFCRFLIRTFVSNYTFQVKREKSFLRF
ncbi:hypothetical protein DPV73_06430 [Leptospira mayottensis]|nr:hypothetical protein DPV73_06430 [Leptospira mayottensis]